MMEKKRSVSLLPALICLAGMAALLFLWRNAYQNAVFSRLSAFCGIFLEQNPQLEGEVLSNPAWGGLTAVREGRFHTLEHELYNLKPNARWGEAYEKLADILYP